MKTITLILLLAFSLTGYAKDSSTKTDATVKKSKSGICHASSSPHYERTKNFTPFKTLDECLKSGGRLPK